MFAENNYEPSNNAFRKIYTKKEEYKISTLYNFFGVVEMF